MYAAYAPEVGSETDYGTRVGMVIRTARYFRERSREQVAADAEVSPETVARWERGQVAIPGHSLSRLAEVLDLPADLLIDPPATRSEVLVRIAAADAVRARPDEPAP